MLISEFIDNQVGSFPEGFYESLPHTCPDCGYPMEMSEALTQLHCSNHRCISKTTQRLVAISNALGIKDFGASRAERFLRSHKYSNPLLIFAYNPDTDGAMADNISIEVSKKISEQFQNKKKFTLAEYVKVAQLPFIQGSAIQIFGKYDDLTEAYKDIEAGGVKGIAEKLNISTDDNELSIRALKIFESLSIFKDDLFQCLPNVEITKVNQVGMHKITAVCSTEVGQPFRTKADFYSTCNNLYPDIHIDFGSSVTKKTEYLIWGGSKETNKVKKARQYNEQFEQAGSSQRIQIMDAAHFLNVLKSMTGENNKEEA